MVSQPFYIVVSVMLLSWACLGEPLVLNCIDNEVELFVRPVRYAVGNQAVINTRLYFYNNVPQFPAPTLKMKAGTQCKLTIHNQLNPRTSVGECNYHFNDVHCPDTTNIHTHGLHVSPTEDDISVSILPGHSYSYTYNILPSHLMGTHWYHSHYHGSVNLQLHGGLHGAIIVEPHDDYSLPSDLMNLYNNAHVLVLSHISLDETPDIEEAIFSYLDVVGDFGESQTVPLNPEYLTGLKTFYTVNGDFQPTFEVEAGSAALLRLVQTSGFSLASITFAASEPDCVFQLVARDGIFQYTPYLNLSRIHLPQGGRADVAVYCSSPGLRRLSLKADLGAEANDLMGRPDSVAQDILLFLNVTSATSSSSIDLAVSAARLPDYLSDLSTVSMTEKVGSGYIYENNTILMAAVDNKDSINGVQFPGFEAEKFIGTLCLGKVYDVLLPHPDPEWYGTKVAAHPYHQHVYSFQILTAADPSGELVRLGEWRDVVPAVYHTSAMRIRFKPMDFTGDVVLHCHILQHEDEGMMALFHVVGEGGNCSSSSNSKASLFSFSLFSWLSNIFHYSVTFDFSL